MAPSWGCLCLLPALLAGPWPTAQARPGRGPLQEGTAEVQKEAEEGGTHWRLAAPVGVVHLWRPEGFHLESAGIVVFVHGYHVTADRVWTGFKMARQFRASHQNALFIVPSSPTCGEEKVSWPAMGELLRQVSRLARVKLPHGHIVVIGHSGAFRTMINWLDYRWLDHLILLDALYAYEDELAAWIDTDKRSDWHRMTVVAADTRPRADLFIKRFSYAQKRKGIPDAVSELTLRQRRARLLFIDSQISHSELVTGRKAIPLLLRLTRLKGL